MDKKSKYFINQIDEVSNERQQSKQQIITLIRQLETCKESEFDVIFTELIKTYKLREEVLVESLLKITLHYVRHRLAMKKLIQQHRSLDAELNKQYNSVGDETVFKYFKGVLDQFLDDENDRNSEESYNSHSTE